VAPADTGAEFFGLAHWTKRT